MRSLRVMLFALILSCGTETSSSWLPAGDAKTILLITVDDTEFHGEVIPFEGPAVKRAIAEGDYELYAIRSSETPAQLDLEPGPIGLAEKGRPLPEPDAPILFSAVRDAQPGAWTELAELPAPVDRLKLEISPCVGFRGTVLPLDATPADVVTFAIELGDGSALVATELGKFFRVTDAGIEPLVNVARTTPSLGAALDPATHQLWLAGATGRVVHGDIRGVLVESTPIPISTGTIAVVRLSGGPGETAFELFAATDKNDLFHFDGVEWTLLRDLGAAVPDRSRIDVAWFAPGSAIATGWGNELVLVHELGMTREERVRLPPQIDSVDALYSTKLLEGFGPTLGTRFSYLFMRENRTWTALPIPPTDKRAYVELRIGSGILFGGQAGVLTQYYPDYGYCSPEAIAPFTVAHASRLGERILIASDERSEPDQPIDVMILEPVR